MSLPDLDLIALFIMLFGIYFPGYFLCHTVLCHKRPGRAALLVGTVPTSFGSRVDPYFSPTAGLRGSWGLWPDEKGDLSVSLAWGWKLEKIHSMLGLRWPCEQASMWMSARCLHWVLSSRMYDLSPTPTVQVTLIARSDLRAGHEHPLALKNFYCRI